MDGLASVFFQLTEWRFYAGV